MKGFVQDIESLAVGNEEFRRVLYTAQHCQLVLMALQPGEEIGAEVHTLDQFFRVEAGARHNIVNTGIASLKLYTLYAPANHRDGVVHHTRADAEADDEHFDGRTTERALLNA